MTTLTPEKREELIKLLVMGTPGTWRAYRSPSALGDIWGIETDDRELYEDGEEVVVRASISLSEFDAKLISAAVNAARLFPAAIERAEKAEDAAGVWRRTAASGLCRAGIATPVNLAEDFHPSDLTHGLQTMQSELSTLRARVAELEGALAERDGTQQRIVQNIQRLTSKGPTHE